MSEKNTAAQLLVTRPADTTAYTAGDVIGTSTSAGGAVLEFPDMVNELGHIIITDVDLRVDLNAVPASMTSFRLHLYNVTPPSALADNAVWDLPSGDRASYLGYVDLGTPVDVGSTLFVQTSGVNKKIKVGVQGASMVSGNGSLFGYLVTNGGYTPTSAATLSIRLNAVGA